MSSRRRLKVLYLLDYLSAEGGAERFTLGLATHVPRDRIQPWVCFTRKADPQPLASLLEEGIPYTGLGRRARWDVHRLGGLVPLLRRERFDVIHSHMFGSNFWGTVLGTVCRVPVRIAHEHTWAYEGNALRMWLDGHVIGRLASRFVAVSEADAERMVGLEGVPADKVVVMPTGYVPHNGSVTATGTDIRAELGLAAATPLIATAATMRPQKALEVLVDAVALLSEQFPEAHLVIAGDGPERAMLEERTLRLGLRSRVHLLGARDDVDAILAAADIAALSSDYEGMPLFMFESAMSGTPLVATAVGALRTLVEDGRSGVLVPPRDPPALADGMAQLLLDPARRERIAAAAAERLRHFTIDAVALEFADLYERLVAEVGR